MLWIPAGHKGEVFKEFSFFLTEPFCPAEKQSALCSVRLKKHESSSVKNVEFKWRDQRPREEWRSEHEPETVQNKPKQTPRY